MGIGGPRVMYRDRAPEYELFMLNRQSFKNVAIPLVPGEMRVSDADDQAFVLAKRGESELHMPIRIGPR